MSVVLPVISPLQCNANPSLIPEYLLWMELYNWDAMNMIAWVVMGLLHYYQGYSY
jgi:hypothetical protein